MLRFQQGQVRRMVVQCLEAHAQARGDGASLIRTLPIHKVGYEARACLYRQGGLGGENGICADGTGDPVGA